MIEEIGIIIAVFLLFIGFLYFVHKSRILPTKVEKQLLQAEKDISDIRKHTRPMGGDEQEIIEPFIEDFYNQIRDIKTKLEKFEVKRAQILEETHAFQKLVAQGKISNEEFYQHAKELNQRQLAIAEMSFSELKNAVLEINGDIDKLRNDLAPYLPGDRHLAEVLDEFEDITKRFAVLERFFVQNVEG